MADSDIQIPVSGTGDTGPKKVDTRTVGAGSDEHRQVIVLGSATTATDVAGITAANGLAVDVTRIASGSKIQLTDGTSDATVRNLAANDALNVAIVDGAGNQVTSFAGSGGTSSTDDADFTPLSTAGTPIMGAYESSPSSVTDTDMGVIGIDVNRRVKVSVDASTLDVAHDAADSGNPVLIGFRALSALPTSVATADRVRGVADLKGRQLVAAIDPGMQTNRSFNATTTQTSTAVWTPTGGTKIAITRIVIGTYGTTSARLILYFSEGAYVAGTSQLVTAASFAPSATAKPGLVDNPTVPIFCTTADMDLRITTDAALSVDVSVYGYEWV